MTFGAPSGALGGSKGDQSGTESRMSTLILPLNGCVMEAPRAGAANRPRSRGTGHHPLGMNTRAPAPATLGRPPHEAGPPLLVHRDGEPDARRRDDGDAAPARSPPADARLPARRDAHEHHDRARD